MAHNQYKNIPHIGNIKLENCRIVKKTQKKASTIVMSKQKTLVTHNKQFDSMG